MYVLIFMQHRWAHPSKQFKSLESCPMQQMCPAAACLPCWPLIQSTCACQCPHLPDLLGHMDFLTLSWRVFPYNLWQFSLRAVNDYKATLPTLMPRGRGGKGHVPQLSQCGQGHNFEWPPILVYVRRQLWAAALEKQTGCLSLAPSQEC